MSMTDRIFEGKLFTDHCEGLPEKRMRAKKLMMAFNSSSPDDPENRARLLSEICGRETKAWVEPPFYFCYGTNIELGKDAYLNFNCNFVDDGKIIVGARVMFGPAVTIATVGHPIRPDMREYMYTAPVVIEENCWIGAGSVICPGVTIGKNSVIGAGSVVTKDIPADCVAAGNPCRVMRPIGEQDMKYYFRDRVIDPEDIAEEAKLREE